MTENILSKPPETESAAPVIHVSPSPHLADQALTTQRIMLDVVIGLVPVIAMALYMFRLYAVKQLAICVISCLAAEALFARMRGRAVPLKDCSALVTGIILALSLPGPAPWYVGVIASFVLSGSARPSLAALA
jgi:electron transport complex protein RnfD